MGRLLVANVGSFGRPWSPLMFPRIALLALFVFCPAAVGEAPKLEEFRRGKITDAELKELPGDLEVLKLRGGLAYGVDQVSDEGVRGLERISKLRVLGLAGLGLTDKSLESIGKLNALEELS